MNVANGLLVSVLFLSSGLLAAQSHHSQWKKVYERDLTDFELSPEGSGLVLLAQPQRRCRMDVDFYGEMGQDKYRYEFTRDRLTAGSHREYRYTVASLSEVTKDKIKLVRNEKLNPASAAVKKEFQDIYQYIPNKVLKKYCF